MRTVRVPKKSTERIPVLESVVLRSLFEFRGAVTPARREGVTQRYEHACKHLKALRERVSVISSAPDVERAGDAVQVIRDYYRALRFLETRFVFRRAVAPASVRRGLLQRQNGTSTGQQKTGAGHVDAPNVTLTFTWMDAFQTRQRCSSSSTQLEKAGLLFNLAVCYCTRAHDLVLPEPLTEAALREALQGFQCAAGLFALIQHMSLDSIGADLTQDLHQTSLDTLKLVMLGNAQLCTVDFAIAENRSSSTVSCLAGGAVELYGRAVANAGTRYFPADFIVELELLRDYAEAVAMQYAAMELDADGTGDIQRLMAMQEEDLVERARRYSEAVVIAERLLKSELVRRDTPLQRRIEALRDRCRSARERCERENAVVFQVDFSKRRADDRNRHSAPSQLRRRILATTPDLRELAASLGDGQAAERMAALSPAAFLLPSSPLLALQNLVPLEFIPMRSDYDKRVRALVERAVERLREANRVSGSLRRELNLEAILASIPRKFSDLRETETPEELNRGTVVRFKELHADLNAEEGSDRLASELIRQAKEKVRRAEILLSAEAAEDAEWRAKLRGRAHRPESAEAQQSYHAELHLIQIELQACTAARRSVSTRAQHCQESSVRDALSILEQNGSNGETTSAATSTATITTSAPAQCGSIFDHRSRVITTEHPVAVQLHHAAARLVDMETRRDAVARELEQQRFSDDFGCTLLEDPLPDDDFHASATEIIERIIERRYGALIRRAEDLLGSVASSARHELIKAVEDLKSLRAERDRELAAAADLAGRVHRAIEDMQALIQERNRVRERCSRLLERSEALLGSVEGFCEARRLEVSLGSS